jgi:photosystem II stability/assembly factor-like uncharacterized protein
MMLVLRRATLLAGLALSASLAEAVPAQTFDPALLREMRWRMIGPHRGSRTKAAAGIPDQPNVFYVGVVNGGVWKTTDYGITWHPIFDDQPTGSVGAIAIAPSNPNIIYVGSGEGLQRPDLSTGDGIYKSTDAGRTWTHLGLRDGQQIPQIIVDPTNPDRLFVAVLGHPYGPNAERGIFRSTDGGRSFQKVFYKDEDTGGVDVAFDPRDPDTIYAVLWEARQGPWENAAFTGPGSGIIKSTDGGETWRPLMRGLPTFADGLGRIGITVAPSEPRRLFATVEVRGQGYVYRSDDAGESWTRISDDTRVASRPSDFAEIKVHPTNPDIVFTGSIVSWKSVDGGRTWSALRGAPGGDDYHRIWINPKNPDIILIAADQGVVITVNGGQSWSSWYNQPTAQFYHVTTDNAFPYRVCSGQQESGSVCIASRGDHGRITFREWTPVGVEEYGYVAPDPLDPDIVYGGKVTRFDRRTGQRVNVGPRPQRGGGAGDYRTLRTAPVLFSPVDPRTLFFASNTLWKTTTGGQSWEQISPDLTRTDSVLPPNVGKFATTPAARGRHPGVIYTIAPSYVNANVIWVGSDDGLIHVTFDGGRNWRDVTPPELRARPWSKISIMDAGRFDSLTAYAAVNTFRLDDLRPHIWRTHDGGRTWQHITSGIPDGGITNVVREDAVRRGLLFAGTEQAVYVSFDDGEHWQSLRLNMPATSIRDLVIKDNDIAVGTHGRSFWILDDISPLRQMDAQAVAAAVHLYRPADAWRVRWNQNTDTPLPPDEPAGENPPDGAIIDYRLASNPNGVVTLEIVDAAGDVVRRYASSDTPDPIADIGNVPAYWIRPTQILSAQAGQHRFVWDVHWAPPPGGGRSYPIAATPHNTAPEPQGPFAHPGRYTVRLTVNGQRYEQPLNIRMDPRVKTPEPELRRQYELSLQLYRAMRQDSAATAEVRSVRAQLRDLRPRVRGDALRALDALETAAAAMEGGGGGRGAGPGGGGGSAFGAIDGQLASLMNLLQDADVAPTTQALAAVNNTLAAQRAAVGRWDALKTRDLGALNERLRQAGLPPVSASPPGR